MQEATARQIAKAISQGASPEEALDAALATPAPLSSLEARLLDMVLEDQEPGTR